MGNSPPATLDSGKALPNDRVAVWPIQTTEEMVRLHRHLFYQGGADQIAAIK